MGIRSNARGKQMRHLIAMEAARLMAEHGIKDYYTAKHKAAVRLGAPDTQHIPRNDEVEQALSDYQRLFKGHTQPQQLKQLRETALQAMRMLSAFNAQLVGSVLSGTAHAHSDINLHLFTDVPEEVGIFLLEENIPFENVERYLRSGREAQAARYPGYRFMAGKTVMDLTIFPLNGVRQSPRSPIDGKPMRRAGLPAVLKLLEESK